MATKKKPAMKRGTPTTSKLNALLDKGLSKQQIVKKYGGTSGLSAHDLDVIGFSNKYISKAKPNNTNYVSKSTSQSNSSPTPTPTPNRGSVQDTYPSIQEYLGADPYYQQGVSDLMNNMDQFNIQNSAAAGDIQQLFDITMQRMNKEKDRSVHDITDDFGARGMVNSGLFGKAVSDYNSDFTDRISDLNRDKSIQLRNLNFERSNMQGLNDSQTADLRLDAIRRRAEEIGSMGSVYDPASGVAKPATRRGTPTTSALKDALSSGSNKKQVVKQYGGTSGLSAYDLRTLGFGDKYIQNAKGHLPKAAAKKTVPYKGNLSKGPYSL